MTVSEIQQARDQKILIADDNQKTCRLMQLALGEHGYDIASVHTIADCKSHIARHHVDVAIVDLNFTPDGKEGLGLIAWIRSNYPKVFVCVLTVEDDESMILHAGRLGAHGYVIKEGGEFDDLIQKMIHNASLAKVLHHLSSLSRIADTLDSDGDLIGKSRSLEQIREAVHRAHSTNTKTFIITGPTGVGKEAIANYIYLTDPRRKLDSSMRLFAIPCGATSDKKEIQSNLFGVAPNSGLPDMPKGGRPGYFERAAGGYVQLDDFHQINPEILPSLLRVLENNEVSRTFGADDAVSVSYKLIITSHYTISDLKSRNIVNAELAARFLDDAECIDVPPLRSRPEDIKPLAYFFLRQRNSNVRSISDGVLRFMHDNPLPHNARDIKLLVTNSLKYEAADCLSSEAMNEYIKRSGENLAHLFEHKQKAKALLVQNHLEATERNALNKALQEYSGNASRAADSLGIRELKLRRLAKKYGLPVGRDFLDRINE